MMRITDTVKHLIIINVIVFIGTIAIGNGAFYEWFSMHFPKNDAFQPWQIFTYMFMHGGGHIKDLSITHLLFNMFALWMFGSAVEYRLGAKRFLFIYISAGLGAVAVQVAYYYFEFYPLLNSISDLNFSGEVINRIINLDILEYNANGQGFYSSEILKTKLIGLVNEGIINVNAPIDSNTFNSLYEMNVVNNNSSMVGASGCVMGIMAAFGMMNPNAELMMIFLPIPIKAKYFIPGIIAMDLISGLTGYSIFSPSNTAHFAHIGGALTGFLIMWYWKKTQFNQNRWDR